MLKLNLTRKSPTELDSVGHRQAAAQTSPGCHRQPPKGTVTRGPRAAAAADSEPGLPGTMTGLAEARHYHVTRTPGASHGASGSRPAGALDPGPGGGRGGCFGHGQ